MSDNDILCVPAAAFRRLIHPASVAGIIAGPEAVSVFLSDLSGTETFRPRSPELEADESFKQLATYVVLRHRRMAAVWRAISDTLDPPGDDVWVYRRAPGSGEGRLHERWSVGIGGHAERRDHRAGRDRLDLTLFVAAMRELAEEVDGVRIIQDNISMFPFLINDDSDPVGRVHLGYGLLIDVVYPSSVSVRESSALDADPAAGLGWLPLAGLADRDGPAWAKLESWSRLVVAALAEGRLG